MGLYNNKGQQKVNIVEGTTYTGIYSDNGEYNGVIDTDNRFGLYHPCGAYRVTPIDPDNLPTSIYAPDGSIYVIETDEGYIVYKENADYNPPVDPGV